LEKVPIVEGFFGRRAEGCVGFAYAYETLGGAGIVRMQIGMIRFREFVELLFDVFWGGIGREGEGFIVVWEGAFAVVGGLVEGMSARGDDDAARE
jgi:hypothetical protein